MKRIALCSLAALVLTAQTPSTPHAFLNVTLGESAQNVVTRLGDPLVHRKREIQDVPSDDYLYISPTGKAAEHLEIVRGYVVGVRAIPAPQLKNTGDLPSALGIALGGSSAALASLPKSSTTYKGRAEGGIIETHRGQDGLLYSFISKGGSITQIAVRLPENAVARLPAQPAPILHSGMRPEDAVVVKAPNEDAGNQFIGVFLSANGCGGGDGFWKPVGPGEATAFNAHPMVKVEAACTSTGQHQTFWFDIRSFYGTSGG